MPDLLEGFVQLSCVLTGERALDQRLAAGYLARIQRDAAEGQHLTAFVSRFTQLDREGTTFETRFREEILHTPVYGDLAKRILVLWYTGGLPDREWKLDYPDDDPAPYFGALMWPVIGAHAPALSGGYFGYWRYPPEN